MNKIQKIRKNRKKDEKINSTLNLIIHEVKILLLIILVILSISLISLINQVILLKPGNSNILYERQPEFIWISRYNDFIFYLSKDKEFSSLIIEEPVTENKFVINRSLYFGEYYWKVVAINKGREISSGISMFKIESLIAAEVNETLRNVGNSRVDIDIIEGNVITGKTVLEINEEMPLSNNKTLYKIKQNE